MRSGSDFLLTGSRSWREDSCTSRRHRSSRCLQHHHTGAPRHLSAAVDTCSSLVALIVFEIYLAACDIPLHVFQCVCLSVGEFDRSLQGHTPDRSHQHSEDSPSWTPGQAVQHVPVAARPDVPGFRWRHRQQKLRLWMLFFLWITILFLSAFEENLKKNWISVCYIWSCQIGCADNVVSLWL